MPNRPIPGASAEEDDPRFMSDVTGDATKDGFTRLARRPRSRYHNESMPLDQADEIEDMMRPVPMRDDY